jgi:hypothetical protein
MTGQAVTDGGCSDISTHTPLADISSTAIISTLQSHTSVFCTVVSLFFRALHCDRAETYCTALSLSLPPPYFALITVFSTIGSIQINSCHLQLRFEPKPRDRPVSYYTLDNDFTEYASHQLRKFVLGNQCRFAHLSKAIKNDCFMTNFCRQWLPPGAGPVIIRNTCYTVTASPVLCQKIKGR